jgi:hypothetical protein
MGEEFLDILFAPVQKFELAFIAIDSGKQRG